MIRYIDRVFYLQSIFHVNGKNMTPKILEKCLFLFCLFVYIALFNTAMVHSSKIIFNLFDDCHKIETYKIFLECIYLEK